MLETMNFNATMLDSRNERIPYSMGAYSREGQNIFAVRDNDAKPSNGEHKNHPLSFGNACQEAPRRKLPREHIDERLNDTTNIRDLESRRSLTRCMSAQYDAAGALPRSMLSSRDLARREQEEKYQSVKKLGVNRASYANYGVF